MAAKDAPVAQLDRALPSEGRGHRFESCRARQLLVRWKTILSNRNDESWVVGRRENVSIELRNILKSFRFQLII
jgi:hypothetical protein